MPTFIKTRTRNYSIKCTPFSVSHSMPVGGRHACFMLCVEAEEAAAAAGKHVFLKEKLVKMLRMCHFHLIKILSYGVGMA